MLNERPARSESSFALYRKSDEQVGNLIILMDRNAC